MADSVQAMFDNWAFFATSVAARDKSIRLLYYFCKMIYSYSEESLTPEMKTTLTGTMSTASLSRKAFRILKSLDHINIVINSLNDSSASYDAGNIIYSIEHIFWVRNSYSYF